jgi:hypothetical protein
MNRARLTTAALALVFSAVILAGTAIDHAAPGWDADTQATAAEAELAEQFNALEKRIDRAAFDLCAQEHGPGATARWTASNELVCHPAPQASGTVLRTAWGGLAP